MNVIPIILTFDNNMSLPAAVCISSMMMSAKDDTFYDIFVLYAGEPPVIDGLERIRDVYPNMELHYRSVGNFFSSAFEIRGITKAAYYRLLAANLVPEYDRVLYSDVDIIYRMDLWDIFNIEMGNNVVAAVHANGIASDMNNSHYIRSIGLDPVSYVVSGFMLMDLRKMRDADLVSEFIEMSREQYKYQDQDIINIVCKNRIMQIPNFYSLGVASIKEIIDDIGKCAIDSRYLLEGSNLHFNGVKPWKGWCPNMDQWWECYRKSPIYDPKVYFSFFYNKLEEYDQLPFIKRLKILLRFFTVGQKKPTYHSC